MADSSLPAEVPFEQCRGGHWPRGNAREIPDEVPLTSAQIREMEAQSERGRSAMIWRSAQERMTPMEMIAAGKVTVLAPDDSLAWNEGRQIPAGGGEAPIPPSAQERNSQAFVEGFLGLRPGSLGLPHGALGIPDASGYLDDAEVVDAEPDDEAAEDWKGVELDSGHYDDIVDGEIVEDEELS